MKKAFAALRTKLHCVLHTCLECRKGLSAANSISMENFPPFKQFFARARTHTGREELWDAKLGGFRKLGLPARCRRNSKSRAYLSDVRSRVASVMPTLRVKKCFGLGKSTGYCVVRKIVVKGFIAKNMYIHNNRCE